MTADALERLAVLFTAYEADELKQAFIFGDMEMHSDATIRRQQAWCWKRAAAAVRTELAALHAADHDTPAPGGDHG
jgi:hypothetical protein